MSYTPVHQQPHNSLDEIGIRLGLHRLKDESLFNFQKRLLLESRERSGLTEKEAIRSLARRVGVFDKPVFDISLVLDGSGDPVAVRPKIDITSSYLRAYSDYDQAPEIEVNFYNESDGKFLLDIVAAFSGSSYFSLTTLNEYDAYDVSRNLRFGSSTNYIDTEILLDSIENKLEHEFISSIIPGNSFIFQTEVNSLSSVVADGQYYIDYTNGVIYTYQPMGGRISYYYNEFPYRVFWQHIKAYPYRDDDKKYFHRNTIIDDATGLDSYEVINAKGAKIINMLYSVHPITWGE